MSNSSLQSSDEHVALFIARVRQRINHYLHGPKPAFLAPVGWILTLQLFVISSIWFISVIPLRISLDIYERHVRAIFPKLPSIRQKLLSLRTIVLGFFPKSASASGAASSAAGSSSSHGSQSTNASVSPLPTLDVDLGAIRAGGS